MSYSVSIRFIVKKTVKIVIESGNDYLIQVKRNQPILFQSIMTAFGMQVPLSSAVHEEYSRGRHEIRTTRIFKPYEDMKKYGMDFSLSFM